MDIPQLFVAQKKNEILQFELQNNQSYNIIAKLGCLRKQFEFKSRYFRTKFARRLAPRFFQFEIVSKASF